MKKNTHKKSTMIEQEQTEDVYWGNIHVLPTSGTTTVTSELLSIVRQSIRTDQDLRSRSASSAEVKKK